MATLSVTEKKIKNNEQAPVSTPEPYSSFSTPFLATDKVLQWLLTPSSSPQQTKPSTLRLANNTTSSSTWEHPPVILTTSAISSATSSLFPGFLSSALPTNLQPTVNCLVNHDDGNPATIELYAIYVPASQFVLYPRNIFIKLPLLISTHSVREVKPALYVGTSIQKPSIIINIIIYQIFFHEIIQHLSNNELFTMPLRCPTIH